MFTSRRTDEEPQLSARSIVTGHSAWTNKKLTRWVQQNQKSLKNIKHFTASSASALGESEMKITLVFCLELGVVYGCLDTK
ncbi:hypothetical protein RRG08_038247 [Elysia crispata]|uniref:Uncharacterized protein n=1 Tax=Elysia crispata TaxID=231223 RepID=A0AAE1E1E3_9GAST|nr:hypothetical protein RRG08_038247 [Elysia crispata]